MDGGARRPECRSCLSDGFHARRSAAKDRGGNPLPVGDVPVHRADTTTHRYPDRGIEGILISSPKTHRFGALNSLDYLKRAGKSIGPSFGKASQLDEPM